jgi:hypothetical protein
MAPIRYCEELKGEKPELSKKITFDIHNLNFDKGETLYVQLVGKYRL